MYKKWYPKVNSCNGLHKIGSQTSPGLVGKTLDGSLLGASSAPGAACPVGSVPEDWLRAGLKMGTWTPPEGRSRVPPDSL